MTGILWFRADLRLADNPALHAAAAGGRPVLPVFIWDEAAMGARAPGGAARWWLHHSLASLARDLAARGAVLHIARGRAEEVLPRLAAATGATEVHAMRAYEPWARAQSERVHKALSGALVLHRSALLHEPHLVRTGSSTPYSVYTPFSRALFAAGDPPPPIPAPARLAGIAAPGGEPLEALALLPTRNWAEAFPRHWRPGEAGAAERLSRFAARGLKGYAARRNTPGIEGTSGLSPHLRWGEISPRQLWHAAREAGAAGPDAFLKEILWREFAYHLLWHRPEMEAEPLRPEFRAFPWARDPALLGAWRKGRTGYPIVDAGMRQLWATGWMHNRVRMIVASFLVKHLLQPWQEGEAWFWDTLVDADPASNPASWQWVAGCGMDAAPYFRIFNPVLQGEKFDPDGAYVRRWVPEVAALPDRFVHRPWEAPSPPPGYPKPVVEHAAARARALAAFAAIRRDAA
ncbi:MAG: DNA photolyase family protein [Acetobacteraceae bacterium]|nr:DNA photolyase family protein [Acetobacteraceae bacterium]